MKTELEKIIVVAEACGLKGPWEEGVRVFLGGRPQNQSAFGYWNKKEQFLPLYDTIDSLHSAVLQQSERFQRKFESNIRDKAKLQIIWSTADVFIHQLTPSDWLDAFVETVEAMK
ncbi:MAG TPA: hypothetical protein VFG51_02870 [Candidatus Saccharimonadia bacterium]|nr:hypothetical protein [Candidatus Saccharimonadia bacterium]